MEMENRREAGLSLWDQLLTRVIPEAILKEKLKKTLCVSTELQYHETNMILYVNYTSLINF